MTKYFNRARVKVRMNSGSTAEVMISRFTDEEAVGGKKSRMSSRFLALVAENV